MHLARFPRRRYTPGWTPDREARAPVGAARRPRPLHQARRPARPGRRRQQDAQARVPRGRRARPGRRHADHLRRRPVEPLPADARRGGEGRAEVPPRARGARGRTATTPTPRGNNFLFRLLGVEAVTVVKTGVDLAAEMQKVADEVAALGRKAYIIPGGGSNPLGALGYVVVRRGDPGADLRSRPPPRPHRLRQRQHRHARRTHLRPRRQQQPHPAHRDQRAAPAPGAGAERPQAGAGDGRAAGDSRAASRARRSPRSATGWARATRCRRPRWSRP